MLHIQFESHVNTDMIIVIWSVVMVMTRFDAWNSKNVLEMFITGLSLPQGLQGLTDLS